MRAFLRPKLVLAAAFLSACGYGGGGGGSPIEGDEQNLTQAKPFGPEPDGVATRYPIVLAHGFNASPTNHWGFYRVPEALAEDGHDVFVAVVPPYESPEVRGAALASDIDEALAASGAEKVNVIAHSMGGLDARHVISALGYGDRVASLTTISTPHRGSRVADAALSLLPGGAEDAIDALAECWGLTFNDLAEDTRVRAALEGLSEAAAPAFAAAHPDDPEVYYQSWAGVSSVLGIPNPADDDACEGTLAGLGLRADKMDATLVAAAAFTAHGAKLLPNDGMATVESAKHGDFRGCIPADHLDEVGQIRDAGPDRRTGFDAVRFYRNVAFELADRGF